MIAWRAKNRNQWTGGLFWSTLLAHLVVPVVFAYAQGASSGQPVTQPAHTDMVWSIVTMIILVLIIGGFLGYLYSLQRQYLKSCHNEKQMALFFQSPGGVPEGTIRSMLALMIVTISLFLIVISTLDRHIEFPEVLSAILGTVLGFYFGSRSSAKDPEGAPQKQMQAMQISRDEAIAQKNQTQVATVLKKVEKGIEMTRTVMKFLPKEMQAKYGGTLGKLEQGVAVVQGLSTQNVAEAAGKIEEVFNVFKAENPLRDLMEKASKSLGRLLGTSVPQIALITTIVGVGTSLVGAAYERWRTRILGAPFSPAVVPLKAVDANTGFALLMRNPVFKTAFQSKLQENDRPFMVAFTEACLKKETEEIWESCKAQGTFEDRAQFEEGLGQFRQMVADMELEQEIDPEQLVEVGGYKRMAESLNKIHADPEAKADLDALITVVEGMQSHGEPVKSIMEKIRETMSK